jgi:hypothetical protein
MLQGGRYRRGIGLEGKRGQAQLFEEQFNLLPFPTKCAIL